MDVADDFPFFYEITVQWIPTALTVYSVPMLNTAKLRTKPIDVHGFALLVILFEYISLVYLLAVAVEKSCKLADGFGLHPRLRFVIADGECVIAIVYQAAIDPVAVSRCLAPEFNRSHNFLILSVNSLEKRKYPIKGDCLQIPLNLPHIQPR